MRFSGKIVYLEYDLQKFSKSFDDAMETQMRQAARAWLKAILTAPLPVIRGDGGTSTGIPPVWTGTARGTLIPLGKALQIAIPINPLVTRPGKGPSYGASTSSFSIGKKFGVYSFRFSTTLPWFNANEFQESSLSLTHATPWGAFKIGQTAFQNYVEKILPGKIANKYQEAIRYKTRIIR